jgi:hypothetical protein
VIGVDGATGEVVEGGGLDPRIAHVLRTVGIHHPSREDALHVALVDAVFRTLGKSYGAQLVAMRFEVAQALRQAGEDYAKAKHQTERILARETVRLVAGPDKVTRALAQQMAEASDEYDTARLNELVQEKREQWLRKLLDTFAAAMDNHRTDRADDRAASRFGASGHVPEER